MDDSKDPSFIRNGIFLKVLNRYETFTYPPMDLTTPQQFWDWMIQTIQGAPPSSYYPVFWKLVRHNLLILKREKDWMKKRQPVMRAVMRMIHYYRAPENKEKYESFRALLVPQKVVAVEDAEVVISPEIHDQSSSESKPLEPRNMEVIRCITSSPNKEAQSN
jgi:hypothetical protein